MMTAAPLNALDRTQYLRHRLVRELADTRDSLGRLPQMLVNEFAEILCVHPDHLRRMVREFRCDGTVPKAERKTKKSLPDEFAAQVALFKHSGDTVEAHKDLVKKGLHGGMCLRTFQRRVREWDSCLVACARGGHREMIKRQFFNREHQPYRTYAYGTDHTKLAIRVIPERGTKPIFPWLSVLMDLRTRLIIAYILTAHDPDHRRHACPACRRDRRARGRRSRVCRWNA